MTDNRVPASQIALELTAKAELGRSVVSLDDNSGPGITRLAFNFANGYTGSVIYGEFEDLFIGGTTHGFEEGLLEVAVCRNGRCVYDTPITDPDNTRHHGRLINGVIGYLTQEEAIEVLWDISKLPPRDS